MNDVRVAHRPYPGSDTGICHTKGKYSVWLPSQIFVIVSRVKRLRNLIFIGDKVSIINSKKCILLAKNAQENLIFKVIDKLTSSCAELITFMRHKFGRCLLHIKIDHITD